MTISRDLKPVDFPKMAVDIKSKNESLEQQIETVTSLLTLLEVDL